ncbi:MAG: dihydroorotase [Gammaproteobacteria bacterium]|nr:dihydroorotase [Gammaproteobacteria bacterium]MDH3559729.1 dihydroorotase [Gammaproteobacteria bacterium]
MTSSTQHPDRIRISGGRVIDPANNLDAVLDVFVADGNIAAVGTPPDGFIADHEIDASGRIVCPGLVDLCARTREPGQEHKATIASESLAAASGGITTLCCPPDTYPVVETPADIELIRLRAEAAGKARVVTLGALTRGLDGEYLSEMAALKKAGCVGVSNALRPLANTQVLRRALEYAATFDLTVFLYADDHWLSANGCAHEGKVATRMGLPGIPQAAETAAIARDLALVEQTGVRAHFCRLSTARAAHMVARAQFDGLPVTADVAIPYLYLTEIDIREFDSNCHVIPPLRTTEDRQRLRDAVQRGIFSAICSDHQPHDPDAKLRPFPSTEPGISGLDTLLPLGLRLVDEQVMKLGELIHRLTAGPARILGLPGGTLAVGSAADICIFDPELTWLLDPSTIKSHGHNTPFMGWELKGRATHTLLAGRLVHTL